MSEADKLVTIAENQQKVYDAGKSAEWNEFWDEFQANGNRTNYYYAFGANDTGGWTDKTFKPKYDLIPITTAYGMFRGCKVTNLKQSLIDSGITLDLSGCKTFHYTFYSMSNNTHIPEIDARNATYFASMFGWSGKLQTIDKIILPNSDTVITSFNPDFAGCNALENIIIEGVIPGTWNMKDCKKLTKSSIISIINALSSTKSGQTVTFSKTAINAAFGINVDDESTFPEGSEYYILRNSKSNWTFSYTA